MGFLLIPFHCTPLNLDFRLKWRRGKGGGGEGGNDFKSGHNFFNYGWILRKIWFGLVISLLPNLKSRLGLGWGGKGGEKGKGERIVVFSHNFSYIVFWVKGREGEGRGKF